MLLDPYRQAYYPIWRSTTLWAVALSYGYNVTYLIKDSKYLVRILLKVISSFKRCILTALGDICYLLQQHLKCLPDGLDEIQAVQDHRIFTGGYQGQALCHFSVLHSLNAGLLQFFSKGREFGDTV